MLGATEQARSVGTAIGGTLVDRINRDPVGFAGVVRLFMLMTTGIAIFSGWRPDVDALTLVTGSVMAFVEGALMWWTRGVVTPDVKVAEKVEAVTEAVTQAATAAGIEVGIAQAKEDIAALA